MHTTIFRSRSAQVAVAVFSVVVICALAGCSGQSRLDSREDAGETLEQLEETVNTPIVYDLSMPIGKTVPTYDGNADASAWIIVVACGARPDNAVLGVVPTTLATADIVEQAKRGEYEKLLQECR